VWDASMENDDHFRPTYVRGTGGGEYFPVGEDVDVVFDKAHERYLERYVTASRRAVSTYVSRNGGIFGTKP